MTAATRRSGRSWVLPSKLAPPVPRLLYLKPRFTDVWSSRVVSSSLDPEASACCVARPNARVPSEPLSAGHGALELIQAYALAIERMLFRNVRELSPHRIIDLVGANLGGRSR